MTKNSGTHDDQRELPLPETRAANIDHKPTCFQCDKEVKYLFADCRCWECTRLTPEEVRGEY